MCDGAIRPWQASCREGADALRSSSPALKLRVRSALRAVRRQLSPWSVEQGLGYAVARRAANHEDFLSGGGVLLYLAEENEVPTGLLLCRAASCRLPLFLPAFVDGEWAAVQWQPGAPLRRGKFGLWEPRFGGSSLSHVGRLVAYVPAVAWSSTGVRLGRGSGAYDRLLARLREKVTVLVIALAYEFQRVPFLPDEQWDVRVDKIVTERRVVVCREGVV